MWVIILGRGGSYVLGIAYKREGREEMDLVVSHAIDWG